MGREASITYQQVADSAQALQAEGLTPSARSIRERLGHGSLGTIQRFLETWRASLPVAQPASPKAEPVPSPVPEPLPVSPAPPSERDTLRMQLDQAQAELSQLCALAERHRQELAAMKTHLDGALAARTFAEVQLRELHTRLNEALARADRAETALAQMPPWSPGQAVARPSPDQAIFLPLPGADTQRFLDSI